MNLVIRQDKIAEIGDLVIGFDIRTALQDIRMQEEFGDIRSG